MNAKPADAQVRTSEPNWGHPTRSQVRRDTSRAERIAGIVWLTIGALFCLFVSVLYIGSRVTIGSVNLPLPWTILFAGLMLYVLSKTALLWTDNKLIAGIPAATWLAGFVILAAWPALPLGGDMIVPASLWAMLLMIAGMIGGGFPLFPRFSFDPPAVEQ